MTPEPISWELWSSASANHRNAKRASLANVDVLKSQLESLSQRLKQPSAGGDMAVYSSNTGAKRDLPPLWSPRTMRVHGVGPSVTVSADEEYGQIS